MSKEQMDEVADQHMEALKEKFQSFTAAQQSRILKRAQEEYFVGQILSSANPGDFFSQVETKPRKPRRKKGEVDAGNGSLPPNVSGRKKRERESDVGGESGEGGEGDGNLEPAEPPTPPKKGTKGTRKPRSNGENPSLTSPSLSIQERMKLMKKYIHK